VWTAVVVVVVAVVEMAEAAARRLLPRHRRAAMVRAGTAVVVGAVAARCRLRLRAEPGGLRLRATGFEPVARFSPSVRGDRCFRTRKIRRHTTAHTKTRGTAGSDRSVDQAVAGIAHFVSCCGAKCRSEIAYHVMKTTVNLLIQVLPQFELGHLLVKPAGEKGVEAASRSLP